MNNVLLVRIAALATLAASSLALPTHAQDNDVEQARLVSVLTSPKASVFDKAKACERLATIGGKGTVPALATLLPHSELSSYSRQVLEQIPDPSAGKALRNALGAVEGDLLVGVVNSIGQRRDTQAIAPLSELLGADDFATVQAAVQAIGNVGSEVSQTTLIDALASASADRRGAVAAGCLRCAQRRVEQDDKSGAVELYNAVLGVDVAKHWKLGAQHNLMLIQGTSGQLFQELLLGEDEDGFRQAMLTARFLKQPVSATLIHAFPTLDPGRQVLMIVALAEFGDPKSLPTVVESLQSSDSEVRIQAARALSRLGNAQHVGILFSAAADADPRLAQAAVSSLAELAGPNVDDAIVSALSSSTTRSAAIAVSARKHIGAASSELIRLSKSSEKTTRIAAIQALGSTIQLAQLPQLIELASNTATATDESATIRRACSAACVRMPQDKCAAMLSGRIPSANDSTRAFLLEQLALVGGPVALDAVTRAAQRSDESSVDAATRVLGEWLSADAAPVLFDLAKSLENRKYSIRALRGYIRIARQLDMPRVERMEVCSNTLAIASRNDEKKLVLEVLRRNPSTSALKIAVEVLNDESLHAMAAATVLSIADQLVGESPAETLVAVEALIKSSKSESVLRHARRLSKQIREE